MQLMNVHKLSYLICRTDVMVQHSIVIT